MPCLGKGYVTDIRIHTVSVIPIYLYVLMMLMYVFWILKKLGKCSFYFVSEKN